jgi:single-strand DNA-binding protein
MSDLNKWIGIGRVCKDSELKYTGSGSSLCNFSIASNRSYKSGDQKKEDVLFLDVTAWGKLAENLAQYIVKGKQVCIEGYLKQDTWEKDGQRQTKICLVAESIQLLADKK